MDREDLEKVLTQAKTEIANIERQIRDLSARRDLLWRFVGCSKDLMQEESGEHANGGLASAASIVESTSNFVAPNAASAALPYSKLWEAIRLVMDVAKRPLTVPEIGGLLEKHKIIIPGEHPRETVRSAIGRRDDVFEKIDRGYYVLRYWPNNIKQMHRDEEL